MNLRALLNRPASPGLRTVATAATGLLIAVAFYATLLHQELRVQRDRVERQNYLRAEQMANLLALQMQALVAGIALASRDLAQAYLHTSRPGFENSVHEALRIFPARAILQIAVADQEGQVVYSRLQPQEGSPPASLPQEGDFSIRDREHFVVHAEGLTRDLFISRPVFGRLSQQWSIQFSRALYRDNRFVGVLVLSVSPAYLSGLFQKAFENPRDVVMLLNDQGDYLARSRDEGLAIGKRVPDTREFLRFPGKQQGTYEAEAMLDGVVRYYGWHRVPGYPLVISLGLDKASAIADSEHAIHSSIVRNTIGLAALLLGAIWIGGLFLQRERNVALTRTTARRLDAIIQHFPGGVLVEDQHRAQIVVNQSLCDTLGLKTTPQALSGLPLPALRAAAPAGTLHWLDSVPAEDNPPSEHALPGGRTLAIERIPLRVDDHFLGTLWSVEDITDRKRREQALETLALRDPLTGLHNRRAFLEAMEEARSRINRRQAEPAVAVMLDIDHFKRVNDSYGHQAGDETLRHLARILGAQLRPGDWSGRLGGEEFALLLPATTLEDGLAIAERIRHAIEVTPAATEAGPVVYTVSFGVAVLDRHSASPEECLAHADAALYYAKRQGRNQVRHWAEIPELQA